MTDLFTIYSYGGGRVLDNIYNAIAVIYQDGYMEEFFQISIMLGLAVAGIKAGITQKHGSHYMKWFAGYLLVILVLMQPVSMFGNKGMTLHWRDVVTGETGKVDHLPPGLVAPAGVISGTGYSMTKLFETLFSSPMPEYLPYHKYGTTFASQVRADLRDMKIQDPILSENLESYISNCVKYDTMIGNIYDIKDLANAPNIWTFLEENSSNLRMFNYRLPNKGGRELINCRTGVKKLNSAFHGEAELLAKKFPTFSRLMNARPTSDATARNGFLKALEVSGKFYGNMNGSASDQLKQILFINQFKTNPHSYGTIRGIQSQNSNWMLLGEIGQLALPILHSIFQALIHASFPIVVTILFFSQRWQTLRTYFEMMIWVELWPILFAILNGAVSIFARRAGLDETITINSINGIVNTQSMYAMMAYGMGLSIPAFAYMITKGGVGQFVHMAGSLMSATNQGAAAAASEVVSGNRSLDNVSVGNSSYNNTSANKFDNTGSFMSGFARSRYASGEYITQKMYNDDNGGVVVEAGAGSSESSLPIAVTNMMNSTMQDTKRYDTIQQEMVGQRKMVTESEKEMVSQGTSYMLRNYDNILRDKSSIISEQGQNGVKLVEAASQVKKIAEEYGYNKEQMASFGISGDAGASLGFGKGSGVFEKVSGLFSKISGSVGVSLGADGKATSTDRQGLSESGSVSDTTNKEQMFDAINSYSKQNSIKEGEGNEISDSKSFNAAYDKHKQKQQSLETMESESKQLARSKQIGETYAFQVASNDVQGFFNYFASKQDWTPGAVGKFGTTKALDHIRNRDKVFESTLKSYAEMKDAQKVKKAGEEQYLEEMYKNDSEYSSGVKNKIQNTKINNDVSKVTPPTEYTEKPKLTTGDNNLKQEVNQKISNNKEKANQKGEGMEESKGSLEKKVNEADKKGRLRNAGLIGTQNQFVKKRREEDESEK